MTGRLPDRWSRLDAALSSLRHAGHAWDGENDCLTGLAGPVIIAMTGRDLVAPWRGRFRSMRGALRVMQADGFGTLADLVASILPEHEHPVFARMGDLVSIPSDDGFGGTLGVIAGERVFVRGDTGLLTIDRSHAARAFKVG